MSIFNISQLLELLAEERALYETMRSLTGAQLAAVESEDSAKLLELIGQKDALMQELTIAVEKTAPLKKAWPGEREYMSEDYRTRTDTALGELRELLEEIFALDDRTRILMEGVRDEVGQSLRKVQGARVAAKAYRQSPPPASPRFKDEDA